MDKELIFDSVNNTKKVVQDEIDKKSEEYQLYTRLKTNTKAINDLYVKLGNAVYETGSEKYSKNIALINDKEKEIQDLRTKCYVLKGYVICGACGEPNKKESSFCVKCGNPLKKIETVKRCPYCGKEIDETMLFCGSCGKKLTNEVPLEKDEVND